MKKKTITLMFGIPLAIALLTALIHVGIVPANAAPSNRYLPSFGTAVAGSYVIHFESGGKGLITLHRDGAYTVSNDLGMDEHGSWYRRDRLILGGMGLAIVQSPNPELPGSFWLRDKDWEIRFTDRTFQSFSITIRDADMIPLTMDPLDQEIEGGFPGELPLKGIGERIPGRF